MTIARGQMNRQLYGVGSPNTIEKLDISDEERRLLERVLEKKSVDYIKENEMSSDDEEVMQRLMEIQKNPAYQYNEKNPYMGPRDMRMGGGIMSVPVKNNRIHAFGGFGGFIGDVLGGAADVVGDVVGGVGDVVTNLVEEPTKYLDPIAQVASFIPGPHQPFAAAYTGARGSGIGGSDYGGFQIGGFTPSGSMFGTTSTTGPSLSNFSFAPQAPGDSGGGIFDSLSSISQFMPMEGPAPTGQTSSGGGIFDGIDPKILEAGMKIGTNYLGNKLREKQEEKNIDQAYNYLKSSYGTSNLTDAQMRAIKIYGGAAVSAALAKLAYESQQQQLEQFKQDRAAYEERRKGKAAEYAAATRPEVTGRPETTEDVVARPTAAMGGIMGSRKGYMMGTEVPLRQNQAGVTEMDYRQTGGFVPPIGLKEKEDDIPAMLSNNEFVFTADAVRAAGGGSVNKGAQRMYALMKNLEGQV